jgi:rhodanese-related sulfurtransferase
VNYEIFMTMNFRYRFSIVLVILGIISLIMSAGGTKRTIPPEEIISLINKGDYLMRTDELAKMIADQDPSLQLVDVRNPGDYKSGSLPGAMNVPLFNLFDPVNKPLFSDHSIKTVFYSDSDDLSLKAWMLSVQSGYSNCNLLEGGIPAWDSLILHTEFLGENISPEENALFEKRYKARRLYIQWNSMPDSLKSGFSEARMKKENELKGGCE